MSILQGRAGRKIQGLLACAAAAGLAVVAPTAVASTPTLAECLEGSDFIANAALSRDHGMTRAAFLERLDQDMFAIRAYPAELRWFVKDEDDERFLHGAARSVFDAPAQPEAHRAAFLRACFDRLSD